MGDKSPKNSAKTKRQKDGKKTAAASAKQAVIEAGAKPVAGAKPPPRR